MRSIPTIQFLPHKNCQFLVYTQQHTRILFWHAFNFRFAVYFTNTVDSIYIVSNKLYSLVLTYSQFQSLQLASHTHSVLLIRSIPSIQSFPHKNSHFLVYAELNTRILFCTCAQLSLCSLFHQYSRLHLYSQTRTVQSDTCIQSVSIITTCFTHTFCSTHAFYSLYSVFSTQKQSVSCLHTVTHTHFVLPMRSTFALQSMLSNTVDSIYIVSYKQYSLILTYSQCQSLQLASHTHSVLLMRSIPSIQSFPHKNSQFLVYTQLHTRILFCPCVNFRFAFHSVKYSRLHLYCQLQTVQSGTYIQSVSIITTCYTQLFCSTHAFYSIYIVLFLINSYLLVCTLL